MNQGPRISVILPTYNRPDGLHRALLSLSEQTLPPTEYEVIVVDDGSDNHVESGSGAAENGHVLSDLLVFSTPAFSVTYLCQANRGATAARNKGFDASRGDVIVFMDDDVTVHRGALEALERVCSRTPRVLARGNLVDRKPGRVTGQQAVHATNELTASNQINEPLPFVECNTQLLAVRREDFVALGKLQDPTGGWPNWDDVDFGYRAHLAGYALVRVSGALAIHWDHTLDDPQRANERWMRASHAAARLFVRHPNLSSHLPMYRDKLPINLREDDPSLVIRKVFRKIASTPIMLTLMESLVRNRKLRNQQRGFDRIIQRWISGGYMYRGYRAGLQELSAEGRMRT